MWRNPTCGQSQQSRSALDLEFASDFRPQAHERHPRPHHSLSTTSRAMATALAGSSLALGTFASSTRASGAEGWRAAPSQITARLPVLRSSFLAKPVVARGAELHPLLTVASLKPARSANVGRRTVASPVCMASASDSAGEDVSE